MTEQRVVQKCLAPFIDKVNFGQFIFEKPFIAAPSTFCKLYDEYKSCNREVEVNCRLFFLSFIFEIFHVRCPPPTTDG